MKKLVLFILSVLILSGCTKTCKNDTFNVDIELSGKNVKSITANFDYETEEEAKEMCEVVKGTVSNKEDVYCKSSSIKVKNYEKNIIIDDLTKENVVEYFEDNGFVCK